MAGLIDTDGTVGIYYKGTSGYQSGLEFYNDSKEIMNWVVKHFGGTYKAKKDPRRKTVGYRWTTQGRLHLCRFIDTLLPYLVLKKSETQIVRQFLSLTGDCPDNRKYLADTCRFVKGQRSIVETDTLGSFLQQKPNLIQAYVAGLLDGDGNIDTYEDSVRIGFTNMCAPLMDILIKMFGGGKYQCKPTTWRWQLGAFKYQENFLLKILPYLVLKHVRAKTALEFVRRHINASRQFGAPCKKLMIQSDLASDCESALIEKSEA
jgi:hypothetical protein